MSRYKMKKIKSERDLTNRDEGRAPNGSIFHTESRKGQITTKEKKKHFLLPGDPVPGAPEGEKPRDGLNEKN